MASRLVALTVTSVPCDVLIVGGGAAGLSAALILGRARRRVAIADAGSPRNAPAAHMQGFAMTSNMPSVLQALSAESADPEGRVADFWAVRLEDRNARPEMRQPCRAVGWLAPAIP